MSLHLNALFGWFRTLTLSAQLINQIKAKVNYDLFTRHFPPQCGLLNFTLSSHRILVIFSYVLIGHSDLCSFQRVSKVSNQFCDWSRKLEQVSKPIRCITNSNDDLVGAFSRALGGSLVFTLRFHWIFDIFSFLLLQFWFCGTKSKKNFIMLLVMIRSCFADCLKARKGSVRLMMYCNFTKKQRFNV